MILLRPLFLWLFFAAFGRFVLSVTRPFLAADSVGFRVRRSGSGAGPQGRLKGGSGYKCGR
jgi:hypothetical protein